MIRPLPPLHTHIPRLQLHFESCNQTWPPILQLDSFQHFGVQITRLVKLCDSLVKSIVVGLKLLVCAADEILLQPQVLVQEQCHCRKCWGLRILRPYRVSCSPVLHCRVLGTQAPSRWLGIGWVILSFVSCCDDSDSEMSPVLFPNLRGLRCITLYHDESLASASA